MSAQRASLLLSIVLLGSVCTICLSGCGQADDGSMSAPAGTAQLPNDSLDGTGGTAPSPATGLDIAPLTGDDRLSGELRVDEIGPSALSPLGPSEESTTDPRIRPEHTEEETAAAPAPQPRLVAPMAPVAPLAPAAPMTLPRMTARREVESLRIEAPREATRVPTVPESASEPTLRILSQPPEASMPLVAEAAPAPIAMETAAPPEAADESPAAAPAPIADDRGDYEAVTVFYGTDRNSIVTSGRPAPPHRMWLYLAGVCGLLCGLFAAVAGISSRKRFFGSLAVMSFSAGGVMAVMGTIAWLQSDGAVAGPKLAYGNDRGEFVMGTCEVSIPRNHQVAELEAPSVFKLDFVENPTKHVVLLDIEEEHPDAFFSKLRSRVDQGVRREAFVFVHGFNVTFEDAARRTAQLSYDLKFQGAPIFYSWPSQGGLLQYTVDETNVVWTVPHLREFLKGIARQSGAESVHLVAHSMGNRALTSALRELSLELRGQPPMFHEVVLTAPDIDADVFRRDIAPAITTTAKRVTLYASSNDEALVLSKQVHGYPRAGDTGDGLVVLPGIETVDVSAVDTSLLGHNYYGDNATVISDMIDLVRNSKSAGERSWLETARLDDLFYWVFRPDRAAVGAAPSGTRSRY